MPPVRPAPRPLRSTLTALPLALAAVLGVAPLASAQGGAPTDFIHSQHDQLKTLLRTPPSPDRDNRIAAALAQMVSYDAMTQRSFGEPCPAELPGCTDHWAALNDAQKAEVGGLLRRLVEKNYRRNISKTLDYVITYDGASAAGGDTSVHTEAKSTTKPRDPAVLIDYIVHGTPGAYRVIDILTEGSSLTKSYYDQFHRMLTNPDQGYPYVVRKLNEKINAPD